MYSLLKDFVYTDLSPDITEHDEDHDASEWVYSDISVYRGALDTQYISQGLDVYSLYNDDSERVGIAEHLSENHAVFKTLWFYDNPWNTLFQEEWKQDTTVYSTLTPEAYNDSEDLLLKGSHRLVLPEYLYKGFPNIYECSCSLSFSQTKSCQMKKKVRVTEPIFIDDSFIIYIPPLDSKVWSKLGLPHYVSSSQKKMQVQIHQPSQVEIQAQLQLQQQEVQ